MYELLVAVGSSPYLGSRDVCEGCRPSLCGDHLPCKARGLYVGDAVATQYALTTFLYVADEPSEAHSLSVPGMNWPVSATRAFWATGAREVGAATPWKDSWLNASCAGH